MRRLFSTFVVSATVAVSGVAISAPAVASVNCTASTSKTSTSTYAHRGGCTNVQARLDRYASTLQIFYGSKGSTSTVSSSLGTHAGNYHMKWLATSASTWLAV